MPHYKTPENKLHWLDSETDEGMLPPGSIRIADGEAESLRSAVALDPVPSAVVTMRQARLALLQSGLLTQVNTAVANMPGPAGDAARIEWEYAKEACRDSPLLVGLAAALELTTTQLDELFTLAGGL